MKGASREGVNAAPSFVYRRVSMEPRTLHGDHSSAVSRFVGRNMVRHMGARGLTGAVAMNVDKFELGFSVFAIAVVTAIVVWALT